MLRHKHRPLAELAPKDHQRVLVVAAVEQEKALEVHQAKEAQELEELEAVVSRCLGKSIRLNSILSHY